MSVGYHSACLYDVTADEYSCCRHSLRTIIALLMHAHSLYAIFVSLVISFFEFGYALIILHNCIIIGQSNFKRYVFKKRSKIVKWLVDKVLNVISKLFWPHCPASSALYDHAIVMKKLAQKNGHHLGSDQTLL